MLQNPRCALYSGIPRAIVFSEACNAKGVWNSEKGYSRQLGFRRITFSETGLPAFGVPRNPLGSGKLRYRCGFYLDQKFRESQGCYT
jgi:hypothetical protein